MWLVTLLLAVTWHTGLSEKRCAWDAGSPGVAYTQSPWVFRIDHDCTELILSELYMISIGDEGAVSLAGNLRNLPKIRTLDLQGNKIGDVGATALAASLKFNPELSWLALAGNRIKDEGASSVAAALKHLPQLNSFDIAFNEFGLSGSQELAKAVASLEAARGGVWLDDVIGLDENSLAAARATTLITSHPKSSCGSPPCADFSAASHFVQSVEKECASILAIAGADRFLRTSLAALGVEDLPALQVLDAIDIDSGLRDARVPPAPRKQLRKCFALVLGRTSEL